MSLPRMPSISLSVRSKRLVPTKRMVPPTIRPGGSATRRRTDSAVTLLPHPDSPTTPNVSPLCTSYETPSTARTTPAAVKKWVCKFSISSSGEASAAPASRRACSIGSTSFKSDTRSFGDIFKVRRIEGLSEHAALSPEKSQRERRHDRLSCHAPVVEPPRFPAAQRRRGGWCLWDALGPRRCRRNTLGVRRLEVSARGARAQPQIGRRGAHGHPYTATPFRPSSVRYLLQPRGDGMHVRQSDPPRPARRQQDDHPRSGAQLADRQGRQDLHFLPAQGCAIPRRRRTDRRRHQGHLRPHRQAAAV